MSNKPIELPKMKNIIVLIILLKSFSVSAQENVEDVKNILNNGKYRQMEIIGTIGHLGAKSCNNGEGYYTFHVNDTVVIETCKNLSWFSEKKKYSVKEENGEFVIYIDKVPYIYKKLPSTAPVCKGEENCIRLSFFAIHEDEYTYDIYLTY